MNLWSFDIEVFKNFFSVCAYSLDSLDSPKKVSKGLGLSHPDVRTFSYSDTYGIDELDELEDFVFQEGLTLVGFNNIFYDTPVMDFVLATRPSNMEIFEFSTDLIARLNGEGGGHFSKKNSPWDEIDLMKAYAFDVLGVSLKQISINLQWWRVQDLPYAFDEYLRKSDLANVLEYNLNDTLITAELFNASHEMMNLRIELSKEYGIDLRSASDSRMANLMLNKIYAEKTGLLYDDFSNLRTVRKLVWLRKCIGKNISFKTTKLQGLLKEVMNTVVVSENDFAFRKSIQFANCSYEIGVGGLHSVDKSGFFFTDDEYVIQDADVASFYPNIILKNNIIPKHLDHRFIEILKGITEERIEAKKKKNTVKADGLKITINSIFGKLNSKTFWLQDAEAMLSVTLSGQLYLLMLIEELTLNGIMVISANTDGIVCRIPRNKLETYYAVCSWWQEKTSFELEFSEYKSYHRIDVNNYVTEKSDGKIKEKGRLVQGISLKKGYRYPVVPLAIYNHLTEGIPVIDTLRSCKNILDFCISQKAGREFTMELRTVLNDVPEDLSREDKIEYLRASQTWTQDGDEDAWRRNDSVGETNVSSTEQAFKLEWLARNSTVQTLQKNNRFFISKNSGGRIVKVGKSDQREIGLFVGKNVVILNDYDENLPVDEYDIDFEFYVQECQKYIDEIENSSFNFDFVNEELAKHELDTKNLIPINEEAEILPPKFRYSFGSYRYDESKGVIYRGIATINYLTDDVAEKLFACRNMKFNSFFDFLVYNKKELCLNSRQMELLIKINFFSEFGGNKKLLSFFTEFNKIYKLGQTEKTTLKKTELLHTLWNSIPNKSFTIREQIALEMEIFGFVQTKFKVPNNKMAFVLSLDTIYSPKLIVLILSSAEMREVKIRKAIFERTMKTEDEEERLLEVGDFITIHKVEKKPAVRKGKEGEEEWVEIPNLFNWWIESFEIL